MKAKDLPSTYLLIWLSVKLPLIILIGLLLIPFTEKNIFINSERNIFFGTILNYFFINSYFIYNFKNKFIWWDKAYTFFNSILFYDWNNLSIYIFKKNILFFKCFNNIYFTFENIKIHHINMYGLILPSRFIDLTNQFELEYQGLSGKVIAKKITN